MRLLPWGREELRRLRSQLIYTWDYTQSTGVEFWPGVIIYATNEEAEMGNGIHLDAGRLQVSWRRGE